MRVLVSAAGLLVLLVSLDVEAQAAQAQAAQAQAAQAVSDPTASLPASARAVLDAIESETTPVPENHYPFSNEWRHDLYNDAVRDLGGAFVGVGTDQCYTVAAVQNASVLFIVDYDSMVPLVHRMHGALVAASETPEQFLARFDADSARETMALLDRAFEGDPDARAIKRVYRGNRGSFAGYFAHVAILRREGVGTSWLSNATLYARVRALFANGRVVPRTGDITGSTTMQAVGAASRQLGLPMRVVYLSNAEAFFNYGEGFTTNMRSLPSDERTIALRTFRHRRAVYPDGDTWHYLVHPLTDFVERLDMGYRRMLHIALDAVDGGLDATGVTRITAETPRRRARPRR